MPNELYPGTLYIVATPIGNMDEITPRALQVLSEVDIIAAEDTRTTGLMLNRLNIETSKLIAYHKFNEAARQNLLVEKLKSGQNIALVSDAGTPCISDPGHLLVKAVSEQGIEIVGVSGPCAVISALCVSGFPAEPFIFVGFLPRKQKAIIEALAPLAPLASLAPFVSLAPLTSLTSFAASDSLDSSSRIALFQHGFTMVFYESPKRIAATVELLAANFPQISLCLCNDLTKKFERIYRGNPMEVLEALRANPHAEKGEYTCVAYMSASSQEAFSKENEESLPSLESLLIDIIIKSGCSMKEAIKTLSASHPKNEIYAASLRLKELFS